MNRPIHFEIQAANPDRAIAFYAGLFGWAFNKWDGPMPYWLVMTGEASDPGINGGLMQRMAPGDPVEGAQTNAWVCTVGVENVDAMLEKGLSLGATLVVPKMPIQGIGWLAYVKDTEGNILGMMQNDPKAGS